MLEIWAQEDMGMDQDSTYTHHISGAHDKTGHSDWLSNFIPQNNATLKSVAAFDADALCLRACPAVSESCAPGTKLYSDRDFANRAKELRGHASGSGNISLDAMLVDPTSCPFLSVQMLHVQSTSMSSWQMGALWPSMLLVSLTDLLLGLLYQ